MFSILKKNLHQFNYWGLRGSKINKLMWPISRSEILYKWRKRSHQTLKGKKKPSEPKNVIWAPKSVWPCDIFIDRKFCIHKKTYNLTGQQGKNKQSEPKKRNLGPKISRGAWYIHRSEILYGTSNNILLGVKKAKLSQGQKRNLGSEGSFSPFWPPKVYFCLFT
jgi:hypothetical protein